MKRTLISLALFGWVCGLSPVVANNITVTNVTLSDVGGGTAEVMFDLSWSNSWRFTDVGETTVQHDAAWVFIKFRAGGEWKHAWLTAAGHTPTGGATIDIGANGGAANVGAFVYRGADGAGYMNCPGMKLRWDYTANGLAGTNSVDISVHAIEMVYIAGGPFWLGSGPTFGPVPIRSPFHSHPDVTQPYQVTNNAEIAVGTVSGQLYYVGSGDRTGPIPAVYPNGFDPFYCMKYEITQGQYARFLNMLPAGQDFVRYPNSYNVNGHTISEAGGVYSADAPDRACNFLSWEDVAAYLDWSGLRPMTELEFEKTCRGPLAAVSDEYAWGDSSATEIRAFNGTPGSGTETSASPGANANFNNINHVLSPVRAGIFATSSSSRHAAGAGYFGVMELSGNVSELVVSVGGPDARSFTGIPGDGELATGEFGWPGSGGLGYGTRGGSWNEGRDRNWGRPPVSMLVSDRGAAVSIPARGAGSGGRGVRSAP